MVTKKVKNWPIFKQYGYHIILISKNYKEEFQIFYI